MAIINITMSKSDNFLMFDSEIIANQLVKKSNQIYHLGFLVQYV